LPFSEVLPGKAPGIALLFSVLYVKALPNPQSSWALYLRGRTYRKNLERYEDALKDLNQAIEFNPNFISAISERGEAYHQVGQYEKALRDFNHVIELKSKHPWAFGCRGNTYLMLGLNNEALMDFNRSLELEPENGWNLYCRALACKKLNRPENAKTDLERAIQLAHQSYTETPDDHQNTFNLALYYLAADNIEQSKQVYRDALNRAVPAARIRDAIRDLEDFLIVFPGHQAAQSFKQGLEQRVKGGKG
jgi:tetratricopeptide (TPR) repeat protein